MLRDESDKNIVELLSRCIASAIEKFPVLLTLPTSWNLHQMVEKKDVFVVRGAFLLPSNAFFVDAFRKKIFKLIAKDSTNPEEMYNSVKCIALKTFEPIAKSAEFKRVSNDFDQHSQERLILNLSGALALDLLNVCRDKIEERPFVMLSHYFVHLADPKTAKKNPHLKSPKDSLLCDIKNAHDKLYEVMSEERDEETIKLSFASFAEKLNQLLTQNIFTLTLIEFSNMLEEIHSAFKDITEIDIPGSKKLDKYKVYIMTQFNYLILNFLRSSLSTPDSKTPNILKLYQLSLVYFRSVNYNAKEFELLARLIKNIELLCGKNNVNEIMIITEEHKNRYYKILPLLDNIHVSKENEQFLAELDNLLRYVSTGTDINYLKSYIHQVKECSHCTSVCLDMHFVSYLERHILERAATVIRPTNIFRQSSVLFQSSLPTSPSPIDRPQSPCPDSPLNQGSNSDTQKKDKVASQF